MTKTKHLPHWFAVPKAWYLFIWQIFTEYLSCASVLGAGNITVTQTDKFLSSDLHYNGCFTKLQAYTKHSISDSYFYCCYYLHFNCYIITKHGCPSSYSLIFYLDLGIYCIHGRFLSSGNSTLKISTDNHSNENITSAHTKTGILRHNVL